MQCARIVLGLLGGIGAGKSYVARRVAEWAPGRVVDADALARAALAACARDGRLLAAFGAGFTRPDGSPDRAALAKRVFSDASALRALERLTHPAVTSMIQEEIHRHRQASEPPVLVLDVPLLIEVGLDRQCDALWFVDAAEDLRRVRATQRGLSVEEMERRERHQSPLDRKRARADLVIVNDGDERSLRSQVRRGLEALGVRSASPA